jgi:ABC-type branched-subunit amino acid transport system substrate-binding protein
VVLDLTGNISTIGTPEKKGMEIAIETINAAGGVNGRLLKTILYDSESTPVKGVTETKRLIDVDKVIACLGYSSSGVTMAAIQTVEEGRRCSSVGAPRRRSGYPQRDGSSTSCPAKRGIHSHVD